jgi:Na+/H+ antiporter NhaD/arsenite permease-like protein
MHHETVVDLAGSFFGIAMMLYFIAGYIVIASEERFHINKAKPALFLGTSMFMIIAVYYTLHSFNMDHLNSHVSHLILEISEIFFFLYVAMTFIEALIERKVFEALKYKLVTKGYTYRELFWVTGTLAFFLSPIADNLTTALILSTVLMTIDNQKRDFLVPGAINIVVAANAGGAWSPFGDITTLMAWQAGKGAFTDFFFLFPASFIGWFVTAYLLSRFVPTDKPAPINLNGAEAPKILLGGKAIIYLGAFTIFMAVISKQVLHLPPVWGMLFGLSILKLFAYSLKRTIQVEINIFSSVRNIEHDTLLFFVGILAAVGALDLLGFLSAGAKLYETYSPTILNIGVGFISAFVDNVPVMSAVLKANPNIGLDQWMLVTMTAGIGGSLISFGSAAGVGVMGKMYGIYTFGSHLKYAWTILVGFIISILVWYVQYEVLHIKA